MADTPGPNPQDRVSAILTRWREMSPVERQPYVDQSDAARVTYQSALAAFKAQYELPRPPMTAYNRFMKERFPGVKAQRPGLRAYEYLTTLAGEWRAMKAEQKEKYERPDQGERKAYEEKMRQYMERPAEERLITRMRRRPLSAFKRKSRTRKEVAATAES